MGHAYNLGNWVPKVKCTWAWAQRGNRQMGPGPNQFGRNFEPQKRASMVLLRIGGDGLDRLTSLAVVVAGKLAGTAVPADGAEVADWENYTYV